MIWDCTIFGDGKHGPLAAQIVDQIRDVCADDLLLDDSSLEHVARSIALFLEHEMDNRFVAPDTLILLASQALSSIGERAAARRLILFGTGLVKPAEWEFAGNASLWALDLRSMTLRADASLEIVFFACLNAVLGGIAEVWDARRGRGVLGLRHVCCVASELLGRGARNCRVTALADEIEDVCRERLARIGQQREWNDVPQVLNLDM